MNRGSEPIGNMQTTPLGMKTGWWSIELPGYRPHPRGISTYSLFSYEGLPSIQEELDHGFDWLRRYPPRTPCIADGGYPDGDTPDLSKLSAIVAVLDRPAPSPLLTLVQSVELQRRIRSCTDCYLDVGDFAVKTEGEPRGHFIHFLSDSQSVLHWYLHVDALGEQFVAVSPNAYGFHDLDWGVMDEIDPAMQDIWYCSPTFVEFIYRFRIENEIWFALAWDKRPLTPAEQAYVDHYARRAA
jgi:hypothetical protein